MLPRITHTNLLNQNSWNLWAKKTFIFQCSFPQPKPQLTQIPSVMLTLPSITKDDWSILWLWPSCHGTGTGHCIRVRIRFNNKMLLWSKNKSISSDCLHRKFKIKRAVEYFLIFQLTKDMIHKMLIIHETVKQFSSLQFQKVSSNMPLVSKISWWEKKFHFARA